MHLHDRYMANLTTSVGIAAVIALIVGAAGGYFSRSGEVSTLANQLASKTDTAIMREEELMGVKAELEKAKESKSMLEAELKARAVPLQLAPEEGQMAHDLWLLTAPLENGKYAIIIRAEGLEGTGVYLVEGVTRTAMRTIPVAATLEQSEFFAQEDGTALYWTVLEQNPQTSFEKILILHLPDMQMEGAVLVATAAVGQ